MKEVKDSLGLRNCKYEKPKMLFVKETRSHWKNRNFEYEGEKKMKHLKKSLCAVLSIGIISSSIIVPGALTLAQTTDQVVVDTTAPAGTITKVMVTFFGDSTTQKGFTWYTSRRSIKSDLQIVEKTSETADFTNAPIISGTCAVPSNKTDAAAPAGSTISKLEFLHKAEATELKPNTTYFYRVGDASLNLWSIGTFQTAPTSGAFTFIDLADPQAKDYEEGLLAASTFKKALDTVPDSKFIQVNGDLVDKGNVEYEWDWLFNNIGQKFLDTTIAPIAGNHDEYAGSFVDHFDLAPAPGCDTTTGVYYSYDYSNAHFVMLNSNETAENNLSPAQITWLTNDITKAKANGAKWIIVNMHKGPYSTSNHATDLDLAGQNGARKTLSPLFAQLGVDLVLQGHDHIYARSKPIKADGTAVTETLSTEGSQGHHVQYEVNPGAPVYLIPATAGPKVYYKNKSITTNPTANGYDPNFYNLFDVADENHAAIYGAAVGDATRPERSNIQNFESITVDGDKLSVISYEIDRNRDNATPYIIDSFGLKKQTATKAMVLQSTLVFANTSSDAESAVVAYEAAPIDTQPHITNANALGALAQTAVGLVKNKLNKDALQARIVAKNVQIATAVVYLNVSTVTAVNGTITLTYNNALTGAPAIPAFDVTQTIGTGVATKVVPTKVELDSTGKIVTLTVPTVEATATKQSVVYTVSYDTAVPVTAKAFSVDAQQ